MSANKMIIELDKKKKKEWVFLLPLKMDIKEKVETQSWQHTNTAILTAFVQEIWTRLEGGLAGWVGGACDSWSQGGGVQTPHRCTAYLKKEKVKTNKHDHAT